MQLCNVKSNSNSPLSNIYDFRFEHFPTEDPFYEKLKTVFNTAKL